MKENLIAGYLPKPITVDGTIFQYSISNNPSRGIYFADDTGLNQVYVPANAILQTATLGTGYEYKIGSTEYITGKILNQITLDDFTLELWVNFLSISLTGQNVVSVLFSGNNLAVQYYSNSYNIYIAGSHVNSGTLTYPSNKWINLSYTRQNGILRGFVDGVKVLENSTLTSLVTLAANSALYIPYNGSARATNSLFKKIRLLDRCIYTESFTPQYVN